MRRQMTAAGAAMAGAGVMYLLDPVFGRTRRAHLKEKAVHYSKVASRGLNVTARDTYHRIQGVAAESLNSFRPDEASDDVVTERIRSALGRVASHPSSIQVIVKDGRVTLSGPVLNEEHHRVLNRVRKIRGVRFVDDRLEVHKERSGEPALQGGTGRTERIGFLQSNWAPATRAVAVLTGLAGIIAGGSRRGIPGMLAAGAGAILFARGMTNIEARRLIGVNAGRRAVDLQKAVLIAVPIEQVFSTWTNYANFPMFMSHVREVRDLGNGHSHWVVEGPAKTKLEWDAVITQYVPNKVIAWKTEPGALVAHAGLVRFDAEGDRTRVQIRFSYNPPGGAAGHSIARLIGSDPRKMFDDDLLRMKTFVEEGVKPRDAAM